MTKSVVSMTFLGTGHHRDKHHNALWQMFEDINNASRAPHSLVAAWLIDGPGSKGSIEHPSPGSYIYNNRTKTPSTKKVVSEWMHGFHKFLKKNYNMLTGEGTESSLLEATLYIEDIIAANKGVLPQKINLQGFSRGADSCVRLANIINRLHPSIEVNVFLIDPVPGPGRRDDPDSFIVPSNVKNFHLSVMLNEHRPPFKPQHQNRYIFQNTQTCVGVNTYAGCHGAGLSTVAGDERSPLSTQALTQDALLRFNIKHGSLPQGAAIKYRHARKNGEYDNIALDMPQKVMSSPERFQYFCQSMDSFHSLTRRSAVTTGFYYSRSILKNRDHIMLDSDIFLDLEHRELFKQAFPMTFCWFFEDNMNQYTPEQVYGELEVLKDKKYGSFYPLLLKKFNINTLASAKDLPPSQGEPHQEQSRYDQPLVSDELSYLRYSLSTITNYYHYHADAEDKSQFSRKQARLIKICLNKSQKMNDIDAKLFLISLIKRIKSDKAEGFIYDNVSKINHDPAAYVTDIIQKLTHYQKKLPECQADIVRDALALIQTTMRDNSKDNYHKRLEVQKHLVSLDAAMTELNKDTSTSSEASRKLSTFLREKTQPSYGETKYIDNILKSLNSYVYWRSFLTCFYKKTGQQSNKMELAHDLIAQLNEIKANGNDLMAVKRLLEQASMGFYTSNSKDGLLWLKQLRFKSDYLNKIILDNLHKVVAVTTVFSHKGQDNAPDNVSIRKP